jgi:hypothetical protein
MAMGNSLSPIVSNIFMEHFEKLALDSAPYKPSLLLRYGDGQVFSRLVIQHIDDWQD